MEPYTLLAPAGVTPQVVTETVYELHRRHSWVPAAVHVITTTTGAAAVRARLLGQEGYSDFAGRPLAPYDAWPRLCSDVLRLAEPPRPEIHVVERERVLLDDIRHPADDAAFADACYRLVAQLTAEGRPRLVGSISGGRKSMSAHVMNAFSALARREDRLCHVLVAPAALEGDRDFFYPTDPERQQVHLVDLAFPRLRAVLRKNVLKGQAPRGLQDLIAAVRPHMLAEERPARAELVVGDLGATLRLADAEGEELGSASLSYSRTATLLVLAEHLCRHPAGVPAEDLFDGQARTAAEACRHPVHQARAFVTALMSDKENNPWRAVGDVSESLNQLKKGLKKSPLAERYFAVGNGYGGSYAWPEPPPCALRVLFAPALRPSLEQIEKEWSRHFPNLIYSWQ